MWPAMREMTAAMDNGGCWGLMVAMAGKTKIAFDGVGNGQQQGGGQIMLQCRQWLGTVQWTTAMAAAMDSGNGGGGGQWRGR
jgi:hypothetical protein